MCRTKSPREAEDAAGDVRTSVVPDCTTALAPARIDVYALSNAIVGQAARVQAIASATFSVCPDSVKVLEHMLQSARVEILPAASVRV
jgi:hypothetical protein